MEMMLSSNGSSFSSGMNTGGLLGNAGFPSFGSIAAHYDGKMLPASGKPKRRKWKKPKGKPKRPLSAYNLFFKKERERLVNSKAKIGFANMARNIAAKWKTLQDSDKTDFNAKAVKEQERYKVELGKWEQEQAIKKEKEEKEKAKQQKESASSSSSNATIEKLQQQNNMLQTYLLQQQVMMQMQAITNDISQSANDVATLPQKQQLEQEQQQRSLSMPPSAASRAALAAAMPDMATSQRRFSMPNPQQLQQQANKPASDSTLDDEDLLLNMPIVDFDATANAAAQEQVRRSSMPNPRTGHYDSTPLSVHKSLDEEQAEFDLISTQYEFNNQQQQQQQQHQRTGYARSASMPTGNHAMQGRVQEMEQLLQMLNDGDHSGVVAKCEFPPRAA